MARSGTATGSWQPGDFESSCGDVHHQPTVTLEGECICLIHVDGRLAFSGPLARMLGALLRL
jgi:anti-sigma factor ChrR (cupin superfamily)